MNEYTHFYPELIELTRDIEIDVLLDECLIVSVYDETDLPTTANDNH